VEKPVTEVVVEELVFVDSMPKDFKESLGLKEASNRSVAQQV
jgi:hypothetical protein